jgi:hypothetical protein
MIQKLKYGFIGLLLGLGFFIPIYSVLSSDMKGISPWYQSGTGVYLAIPTSNVRMGSGQLFVSNGAVGTPSVAWNTGNDGFFSPGAGLLRMALGGLNVHIWDTSSYWLFNDSAIFKMGTGGDIVIARDAPNTLALKNGSADQAQRWYGANGSYFQIATQSELLTIGAGVSTPTAMSIPANSIVRGVAVYVVTVIPVAATFTVTGTTSATVFNTAAVGTGAGSNDVGTQNTPYKNGAAQTITITPNLPPVAATGQVRIVLMYEIPFAPTS